MVNIGNIDITDVALRSYQISFELVNGDTKEIIVSGLIEFSFDVSTRAYSQLLIVNTPDWTGSINPRTFAGITPTGSVYLQSPKKDVFYFDFILQASGTDPTDITSANIIGIGYYVNQQTNLSSPPDSNNCSVLTNQNQDLTLQIFAQTDSWGLNLIEISGVVTTKKKYPNGYPDELVGYCDKLPPQNLNMIQTLYSFSPNLRKVLKLKGSSLLDQTNKINAKYNGIDITDNFKNCEFYEKIITYSAIRYLLGD